MSVSDRIIKKREELNLSQTDLAKRAGLKPPSISQYESGSRSPSYEALLKLSNALNVTTDYLISGREGKDENTNDKVLNILNRIVPNLTLENKDKLLEYAVYLASNIKISKLPILGEIEYADLMIKNYSCDELPVDVYDIAKKMNISVFEDELTDGEGMLIKGNKQIIILNKKYTHTQRKRYTIAILLGHSVIPWHVQSSYIIRKSETSTLLTDNVEDMEAQDFACRLLMPQSHLIKEFVKMRATIDSLKKLAAEKYDVSLFFLMNRLVGIASDTYTVIQSDESGILKTYPGDRPLIEDIDKHSFAASFYSNRPDIEEIRQGSVYAKYWLQDATDNEMIYEESIFNPQYGKVLTLLTINNIQP